MIRHGENLSCLVSCFLKSFLKNMRSFFGPNREASLSNATVGGQDRSGLLSINSSVSLQRMDAACCMWCSSFRSGMDASCVL